MNSLTARLRILQAQLLCPAFPPILYRTPLGILTQILYVHPDLEIGGGCYAHCCYCLQHWTAGGGAGAWHCRTAAPAGKGGGVVATLRAGRCRLHSRHSGRSTVQRPRPGPAATAQYATHHVSQGRSLVWTTEICPFLCSVD